MYRNYIKLAFRNILKQKGASAINIFGLSFGIAASLLIMLYTYNVLTFDAFHKNASNIYLIYKIRVTPTGSQRVLDTWVPMKDRLIEEYPGIVNGFRTFDRMLWVSFEEKRFNETINFVDQSLFELFDFKLKRGNPENALTDPTSAIITQKAAIRLFGSVDPMGKVINVGPDQDLTITGVLDDVPVNSSLTFNILTRIENSETAKRLAESWSSSFLFTYLQLDSDTNPAELESNFPELMKSIYGEDEINNTTWNLMPFKAMNNELNNTNSRMYVLIMIAITILFIAAINFTNLATARSIQRAREIGLRKVLGAARNRLITQFLSESILTTFISLLLALTLAFLFLPTFSQLVDIELAFSNFPVFTFITGLIFLGIIVGVLAGLYPAFYLSGLKPVETITGRISNGPRGNIFRSLLVILQFASSIALIIGAGYVYLQIDYMKNQNLSFDKDNLVVMQLSPSDFSDSEEAVRKLGVFKNEISNIEGVVSSTASSSVPGRYSGSFTFIIPEGWNQENRLRWRYAMIDNDYFETFGVKFNEGRNFNKEMLTELDGRAVILNSAAKRAIGEDHVEGLMLNRGMKVVGVVNDFNYQSLQNSVLPIAHVNIGLSASNFNFVTARIQPGDTPAIIEALRAKWELLGINREFNFYYLDEDMNTLYSNEENLADIVGYSALFVLIIACLGLLGMASFTTIQRTREIGIRKIVGASNNRIVILLVKQFVKPALVANLLAWPLAYYLIDIWMQEYAYKVAVGPIPFIMTSLFVALLSVITVSVLILKAANRNSVEALRQK